MEGRWGVKWIGVLVWRWVVLLGVVGWCGMVMGRKEGGGAGQPSQGNKTLAFGGFWPGIAPCLLLHPRANSYLLTLPSMHFLCFSSVQSICSKSILFQRGAGVERAPARRTRSVETRRGASCVLICFACAKRAIAHLLVLSLLPVFVVSLARFTTPRESAPCRTVSRDFISLRPFFFSPGVHLVPGLP